MTAKRNVFIMGDSYSTYKGYIPDDYHFYYYDEKECQPIVRGVEKTWWNRLAKAADLNIVLNDSYSGTTVCNTVRDYLSVETSFVSRIDRYIATNFFADHQIDTMFIFGGTNDSCIDAPIGDLKYEDWTADDMQCVLPAFCYLISRAKQVVVNIVVLINADYIKAEITKGFSTACEEYGVKYLQLKEIDKENNHPTELGMMQIYEQIMSYFPKYTL